MKKCSKCGNILSFDLFVKDKSKKDGYYSSCKKCNKKQHKESNKKYREKVKNTNWYKEQKKSYRKKYYIENKSKEYKNHKKWLNENREVRRKHYNNFYEKHKEDINFRLKLNIRNRIKNSLRSKKTRKDNTTTEYIGCSFDFYRQYLEERFKDGMSWDNYGEWHIDHIKPLSLFDFNDEKELKEAFHYTNTQPLWAKENLSKGIKYANPIEQEKNCD